PKRLHRSRRLQHHGLRRLLLPRGILLLSRWAPVVCEAYRNFLASRVAQFARNLGLQEALISARCFAIRASLSLSRGSCRASLFSPSSSSHRDASAFSVL